MAGESGSGDCQFLQLQNFAMNPSPQHSMSQDLLQEAKHHEHMVQAQATTLQKSYEKPTFSSKMRQKSQTSQGGGLGLPSANSSI